MQRVIMLRGVPASGKTTLAKIYRNFEEKVAWLKVDNFKVFFAEDSTPALSFVNGAAIATLEYLLKQGFSVVVDGVFQDTSAIDKALEIAQKHQVPIKVFELKSGLEVLQKRDKERDGVPEGIRKPLGDEVIANIFSIINDNPYPNAIELDTENSSIEECVKQIDNAFSL